MSSNLKDVLSLIEQFENAIDSYQQNFKRINEEIIQNLTDTWKNMKNEQTEIENLEVIIRNQNSEIMELRTKLEDLDKKIEIPKRERETLLIKINEFKTSLERIVDDLKKPKFELDNLNSNLNAINEKIRLKEAKKLELEQKKLENENKERELKINFSEEKLNELERKLLQLKQNNFFTTFLIEHSDEEIPEVDIIATIMSEGSCNLDELKKLLDVPPIMAVRTIKQLAIKGIINLDESTNIITMP